MLIIRSYLGFKHPNNPQNKINTGDNLLPKSDLATFDH